MTAKTRAERFTEFAHHLTMQSRMCVNCRYYFQHYARDGAELNCGHCTYPRMKYRAPFEDCDHFENRYGLYKDEEGQEIA